MLSGNTTIKTSKCIEASSNTTLVIDVTDRETGGVIISYECLTVPDIDIELKLPEGKCGYVEKTVTSISVVFTPCVDKTNPDDNLALVVFIISVIAFVVIILVVILIVVSIPSVRQKVFPNRTNPKVKKGNQKLSEIQRKLQQVEDQIDEANAGVKRLNTIMDEF